MKGRFPLAETELVTQMHKGRGHYILSSCVTIFKGDYSSEVVTECIRNPSKAPSIYLGI